MLEEKEARRAKLFCQIVDDSGKLLTRRSLSIRRSSSIQWQASQSLDGDPAKPSASAAGITVLPHGYICQRGTSHRGCPRKAINCCWALAEVLDVAPP